MTPAGPRAAGRLVTEDWDRYNGASVVFEPARMTEDQLRHAQRRRRGGRLLVE